MASRAFNVAAELLDRNLAEGRAGTLAYLDDLGRCTYGELHARANRAGNAPRALGVQAEQRVLLSMVDTADFAAVFLGAIKIGAVPVPLNTLLPAADYLHPMLDSRARVAVVSDLLLPKLREAIAQS